MVQISIDRPNIDPERLAEVLEGKGELGKIYKQVNAAIKPLLTKYEDPKRRTQLEASLVLMFIAMCMQYDNWGQILAEWNYMQNFGNDVMRCMINADGAATTLPQKEGPDPAKMN